MLFLIFSPLFLIEFFVSGRFPIEEKYWKGKFNNLKKKKQLETPGDPYIQLVTDDWVMKNDRRKTLNWNLRSLDYNL